MSLGSEIKEVRGSRTAIEIATAVGCSPQYLCDIEAGRRVPPPHTIEVLATALRVKPNRWLWLWVEEQMGERRAQIAAGYGLEPGEAL